MSRYKGAVKPEFNERNFPNLVLMAVPGSGFRRLTDEFESFHCERDIQTRHGRGRRDDDGGFYVTWCFADPAHANAFAAQFGGERFTYRSRALNPL